MNQPLQTNNEKQIKLLNEASRSAPDLSSPKLTTTTTKPTTTTSSSSTSSTSTTISSKSNHHHQRSQSHLHHSVQFERRFQALLEIIETEDGYLRDLKRLDGFYLSKIDSATSLKLHQKQIIRRNIAQVIELAERFSRRISIAIGTSSLTKHQSEYSSLLIRDDIELDRIIERLAKAFISESPIFTIYEEFCAKHTEAADLIRSFESSPEWHSLLHQSNNNNNNNYHSPSSDSFNLNPTSPPSPATITNHLSNQLPSTRLSLQDYIIKPIQRIMRYPMLLNALLKQMNDNHNPDSNRARERVQQALWAMKQVAEGVDEAKSLREVELKTELIASRMELHSSYRAAFVCLLGQIKLVGSLHILYHGPNLDPSEAFKIKYYGIFLYQTHLVVVKVKRATVYEPRHWFPIRYFDLVDISDSSGLMPYSFSLKYKQHTFEFGATCEPEKRCWMNKLRELKAEIDHLRSIQIMSAIPISDDSIVSSINLTENSNLPSTIEGPPRNGSPIDEDPTSDEPTPTTPAAATATATQSRVSQRLSRNVNTLLGRTAEVAQAAIDLKLTEVFSDVLLCARLQDGAVESGSRTRTLSTAGSTSVKRNSQAVNTNRFGGSNTLSGGGDRKIKRMSYMEPNLRSREMIPPLPRLFNSSPETASSASTRSSLRRARSGPALVTSRSSSSLHRSDLDDQSSPSQPLVHHRVRSRNHSTTTHLVVEPSNCDSPTFLQERSLSPENDDESTKIQTALADDQIMIKSSNNNNNNNNHNNNSNSNSNNNSNNNSHFGSSNLWFPGLKMVRRLSRVGTKSKKEQDQSLTSSAVDHQDLKESNNRISSSHHHTNQQSNSHNNSHKSREQNDSTKKTVGRMIRQGSAPDPSHLPIPSTTPAPTTISTIGKNNGNHHQNTFKRVFMKRHRSSGSSCPHPHHHSYPNHNQLHLSSNSSSAHTSSTLPPENENNYHDPSLFDHQKINKPDSNLIPAATTNTPCNNIGVSRSSSTSTGNNNNIAGHINLQNTSKSSLSSMNPSPNTSSHNLASSSSSTSNANSNSIGTHTGGNNNAANPFGSMLRSIMRMTPLSDLGPSSSSTSNANGTGNTIAHHSLVNPSVHSYHSSSNLLHLHASTTATSANSTTVKPSTSNHSP